MLGSHESSMGMSWSNISKTMEILKKRCTEIPSYIFFGMVGTLYLYQCTLVPKKGNSKTEVTQTCGCTDPTNTGKVEDTPMCNTALEFSASAPHLGTQMYGTGILKAEYLCLGVTAFWPAGIPAHLHGRRIWGDHFWSNSMLQGAAFLCISASLSSNIWFSVLLCLKRFRAIPWCCCKLGPSLTPWDSRFPNHEVTCTKESFWPALHVCQCVWVSRGLGCLYCVVGSVPQRRENLLVVC